MPGSYKSCSLSIFCLFKFSLCSQKPKGWHQIHTIAFPQMLHIAPELGAVQNTAVYPKPAYHCCLYIWLSIQPYRGHKEVLLSLKSTQDNSECETSFCIGASNLREFSGKEREELCSTTLSCHAQKVLCPCLTICLLFSISSARAHRQSSGSRACTPRLPSKVLSRYCPCPGSTLVQCSSVPLCTGDTQHKP